MEDQEFVPEPQKEGEEIPPDFEASLAQAQAKNEEISRSNARLRELQSRVKLERENPVTDYSKFDEQCLLSLHNIRDPAEELAEI
jgi:hypothetical protein